MSDLVSIEIEHGIATVTMDDGKVNALSAAMLGAIDEALNTAEDAQAVVVLKGREGIFSAGFDMKTFTKGPAASVEMIRAGAEMILRFMRFPYPLLTACAGHAYPMGAFLMLAADARIGVTGPWKIGLNEVAIAMTLPQFGVETARHRLTPQAFSRANTGTLFTPEDAARGGYFDVLVDPSELDAAVEAEAARLRALDMPSFKATKAKINAHAIEAIEAGLEAEFGQESVTA